MQDKFKKVTFTNYKAFKKFAVPLTGFNVLVGPNNSGKSTILGAFRILSEGIRKASAKKPEYLQFPPVNDYGYIIPLSDVPIAGENIFTDYDDQNPAAVEFQLASRNTLSLIFPESGVCYMKCETPGRPVRSPSDFKREFKVSVGLVPVLGPVEHNERLYQQEAARRALLSHGASRNFRNIWHHYPERFDQFKELVASTWPGMEIKTPEIDLTHSPVVLHMYCSEKRIDREIFWAGFGFQVWCQMLTYVTRSAEDSLLVIDEPDIYLHSDLQRQLVQVLQHAEPDVLIATHSAEIICEVDPADLIVVDKANRSARRIKSQSQIHHLLETLGSSMNPTLTQLAKTSKAIFVEGKDFKLLAAFAGKLGIQHLANGSSFAVIPAGGFNPSRVSDFSQGIETTLGKKIQNALIFDRDYRSNLQITVLLDDFKRFTTFAHVLERKEIENYLLVPSAIQNAIERRIAECSVRGERGAAFNEDVGELLSTLTDPLRNEVIAQSMSMQSSFLKSQSPNLDISSIHKMVLDEFENSWSNLEDRINVVSGKQVLALLNTHLQENYAISLTAKLIIKAMRRDEVPDEIVGLLGQLDKFGKS